jgi:hypothetical protein
LLAGVEVDATLLDPETPQELENRRSPADPIVSTENIFIRIFLQGDPIGTIQNECDTMEDV